MSLPNLPAPDADVLHVHTAAGGSVGPISRKALHAKVARGEVARSDSFWFDGMSAWARIAEHPVLLQGLDEAAPAAAAPAAVAKSAGGSEDDRLDRVFGQLVQASWDYYEDHAFASHVDEVFLGAIITSTLDIGYSLIDLSSDGTHHYVRFEDLNDHSRIIVRLTHLTGSLTAAKVQGHRASVIVGYGERISDFSKIWQALKAEAKSGYIQSSEPGTITVDGDINTSYIYVQVDLFLTVDDYVKRDYSIRQDVLKDHLGATTNALRKYLRGRFK